MMFKRFWIEYRDNRVAVAALGVALLMLAAALLAPWIAPQDPYDLASLRLMDSRKPPGFVNAEGFTYLLGTDAQGRDVLSAILHGLRLSVQISLIAGAIAFTVGATLAPAPPLQAGASRP